MGKMASKRTEEVGEQRRGGVWGGGGGCGRVPEGGILCIS